MDTIQVVLSWFLPAFFGLILEIYKFGWVVSWQELRFFFAG